MLVAKHQRASRAVAAVAWSRRPRDWRRSAIHLVFAGCVATCSVSDVAAQQASPNSYATDKRENPVELSGVPQRFADFPLVVNVPATQGRLLGITYAKSWWGDTIPTKKRKSRFKVGAIGAGIGVAGGIALGAIASTRATDCELCWLGYSTRYGLRGGAIGAIVALLITPP